MTKIDPDVRIAYKTCRRMAEERIVRLAESLGVDSLPLDVVAPMLPTLPEWTPSIRRRRRGAK